MKKHITIFSVQPERPSASDLAHKITTRRLERRQMAFAKLTSVAQWVEVESVRQSEKISKARAKNDPATLDLLDFVSSDVMPRHHPDYPKTLSHSERNRIMDWCDERIEKMVLPGHALPSTIGKDEKKDVRAAAAEMRAVYLSDHEIDVAFSEIHKDFPWLAMLTEKAWKQAIRRTRSGLPAGVGPLLLLGPPGMGKSSWARAVADRLGVPRVDIDVGQTGGVFEIQGLAKGWGSADKGRLVGNIISHRIANPLLVVDEIDAGSKTVGTLRHGNIPGLFKVLMGLIEPSTAKKWVCPFYQVPFDMRHVSWIGTCNSISYIEQALLDRMTIIDLPDLTPEQILAFAEAESKKKFDDPIVEAVVGRVGESLRKGKRLSLRHVVKLIGRVEEAAERPVLH